MISGGSTRRGRPVLRRHFPPKTAEKSAVVANWWQRFLAMVERLNIPEDCEPAGPDPQAESLWATEIERRACEVAEGKVDLVDADGVHAEIARRLRTRAAR
jgi:hypothetical protein